MECASAFRGLAAVVMMACAAPAAQAHPHMWIDARARIAFDDQGRMTAIEQDWLFDEMFGAYTTQGLEKGPDGSLPAKTLQGMAKDWMQALGEPISHYFTQASVNGKPVKFAEPRDAVVSWDTKSQRLTLSFTLPLAQPMAPDKQGVQFDIYDPTYFVAYDFGAPGAVSLIDAPKSCQQSYRPPRELDWQTMQKLAAIPAEAETVPDELLAITKGLTHRIDVSC